MISEIKYKTQFHNWIKIHNKYTTNAKICKEEIGKMKKSKNLKKV